MRSKGYMKIFLYSTIIFISLLPVLSYVGYSLHTKSNEYGECIGINEPEEINLNYEASKRNILISIIFIPSILVPSMIVANDLYCPTGIKWLTTYYESP